jgi:N-acetyl-anhydromuramyl-L-alanine amidase AmpD
VSQRYQPALWIPSAHCDAGRSGHQPRWIIVHGTAGPGTAEDIGHFFETNDPPTSTHFVIDRDGMVVQCVAEADTAWGNGFVSAGHDLWWSQATNPNLLTLSIEHVKPDPRNTDELTGVQQEASFALIKYLCEAWDVPPRRADRDGGITGHSSIDPVHRWYCPGPYPWEQLFASLNG